jgi:LysM repeat protein
VPSIAAKAGTGAAGVLQADGKPLAGTYKPTAGDRLKIPGIRYIRAVKGDTLASLAGQNGVTAAAVAAANGFPAGSPDTTLVAAGRRILIPVRP